MLQNLQGAPISNSVVGTILLSSEV